MASTPDERLYNNLVDFDAAHLPPGPDGVPRAGSSDFPNSIDLWPAHSDGWDEKTFSKYAHDTYCALIQLQRVLKLNIIDGGMVHRHAQFVTTYQGDPTIEITTIAAESSFISGTVGVAFRGKVLAIGIEWDEEPDLRSIRLYGSHPDTEAINDILIITYAEPLSL
jgi:hypothetical protein